MQCNKLTSGNHVHFDAQKYHEIALQASNHTHDLFAQFEEIAKSPPTFFPCLSVSRLPRAKKKGGGSSNSPTLPLRTSSSLLASTATSCNCNSNQSTASKGQ